MAAAVEEYTRGETGESEERDGGVEEVEEGGDGREEEEEREGKEQGEVQAQFYSMPTYAYDGRVVAFPQYYYPSAHAAYPAHTHDPQAYAVAAAAAAAAQKAASTSTDTSAVDDSAAQSGASQGQEVQQQQQLPYMIAQAPVSSGYRRPSRNFSESGPFFRPTEQICGIFSMDRNIMYQVNLLPRIDRGFFMAEDDWTCYRRNYFQVSVSFTCNDPNGIRVDRPCAIEIEGRGLVTVLEFQVAILAKTSNGSREIEIVQHTAKRDKGPQMVPQPKRCDPQDASPGRFGRGESDSYHTVTFERLQFKSATQNNGKRRAAQQYHILVIELLARLEDGMVVRIAATESAPLVVRGRAPGHYAAMNTRQKMEEAGLVNHEDDGDDSGSYTPGADEGAAAAASSGAGSGAPAGYQFAATTYMGHPAMMQHPGQHIAYQAYQAIPISGQEGQEGQEGATTQPMPAYYHVVQAGQHAYYHPYDPAMWNNAAAAAAAQRAQLVAAGGDPAASHAYAAYYMAATAGAVPGAEQEGQEGQEDETQQTEGGVGDEQEGQEQQQQYASGDEQTEDLDAAVAAAVVATTGSSDENGRATPYRVDADENAGGVPSSASSTGSKKRRRSRRENHAYAADRVEEETEPPKKKRGKGRKAE
ncbi:meiosis-specific transcription factor ndt80 [Quaeritorhiza haematococci]|nr:meiosis-specific transcription factor ndt80 [Quaeritorhiza haematococci]